MPEQTRLPLESHRSITPDKGRRHPLIWIREIRLLRELKPDTEVIRTISLRPGLNVLWAKPADKEKKPELYEDGMSGHATGKTTFCRLLRYVLGEGNYGNVSLREGVRRKFDNNGWVVAEVHIKGSPWVVCRPLGVGPHSFAIADRHLDRLFDDNTRTNFEDYLEVLYAAVMDPVLVKRFTSSGKTIGWQHFLPWLARDQECRYRNLVEWRDPLSESSSPEIPAGDRQYLVRAIMGLVSEQEQKELELNSQLLSQNNAHQALLPKLQHQSRVDLERLKTALKKELPEVGGDLFYQAVNSELEARSRQLDEDSKKLPDVQYLNDLQEAWRKERSIVDAARSGITETEEMLETQGVKLRYLRGEITAEKQRELLTRLSPPKGYCGVPIDIAREAGCHLAIDRNKEALKPSHTEEAKSESESIVAYIAKLSKEVASKRATLNRLEVNARSAQEKLFKAQAQLLDATRRITMQRDQIEVLRTLAANARDAWDESQDLIKKIALTAAAIEDSRKRQEQIRKQHQVAIGKFSDVYNQVIRAVMGNSLFAGVEFSGRSIQLSLEYHGALTSAAIESIKIIAFDIAAMLSSLEGVGFHPRFLIHDGPREADMSAEIYQKFFLFARAIETAFGTGNTPNFQYIITTTEPPPEDMRQKPWLLDTLDASDPEKRLFRVDL